MRPQPTARLGRAVSELGWALLALFFSELLFTALLWSGALPGTRVGHLWLFYGPARTALAAALYLVFVRAGGDAVEAPVRAFECMPGKVATGLLVVGHIALAAGGSTLLALLLDALGHPVVEQAALVDVIRHAIADELGTAVVILVGTAVVAAPIAEEWYFRHLLFRRTLHRSNIAFAYVVSALPFALVHMNVTGIVVYTWLGLVFASAYVRTGRLWCAIAVHAANNAIALLLYFFVDPPA